MAKFHWIDDDIKINFKVPSWIQEKMDLMEKYDLENDVMNYEIINQGFDVDCKNTVAIGKLTEKQWDILMCRYR